MVQLIAEGRRGINVLKQRNLGVTYKLRGYQVTINQGVRIVESHDDFWVPNKAAGTRNHKIPSPSCPYPDISQKQFEL